MAVGQELDAAVEQVQEFGGDVSLPEAADAFVAEDGAEGVDGAFVDWIMGVGVRDEVWVGEGVDLELETDFYDVEGGDAEAVWILFSIWRVMEGGRGDLP